jgi:hypothetical protein
MTPPDYALILLAVVIGGVLLPILLRAKGKLFGLPPSFWAGLLLVAAVAAIAWVIRRLFI